MDCIDADGPNQDVGGSRGELKAGSGAAAQQALAQGLVQLAGRVGEVGGHGRAGQADGVGDELVGEALQREGDDLALAEGEPLERRRGGLVAAREDEALAVAVDLIDERPAALDEPLPQLQGLVGRAVVQRAAGLLAAADRGGQDGALAGRGVEAGVLEPAVGRKDGVWRVGLLGQALPQAPGARDVGRDPDQRVLNRCDVPPSLGSSEQMKIPRPSGWWARSAKELTACNFGRFFE